MSNSVDRARVEELLQDQELSYREIAREVGCSDWSVRRIARDLAGDFRPMKREQYHCEDDGESLGLMGWAILAGIVGLFVGVAWLARGARPPEM